MAEDAAEFTVSLNDKISAGAKSASSSLDGLDKKLKSASKSTDEAGSAADAATGGMAALAGAIIATEAAAVGLVVEMAKMSIEAHEAQEAALALAEAEYGSAAAARSVVDAQYAVSASSSLAQDKVFALARKLEDAGESAGLMKSSLKAMADTAAVAGEQATKPIEKVIKKVEQLGKFSVKDADLKGSGIKMAEVFEQLAKDTGSSVDTISAKIKMGQIDAETGIAAMNKVLETKFGGAAAGKMLAFDTQIAKAKENLSNMFKDVAVEPFLKALQKVLSILDPATKTGQKLKSALTGAMNSFFKAAASALPYIEAFLLGVGIAGLDIYIALKPSIKAIEKALGFDGKTTSNGLKTAATAGKALVAVLFGIGVVAAALVAITALPFVVMGTAVYLGIKAVKALKAPFIAAGHSIKNGLSAGVEYVESLPGKFAAAGSAMIEGLVNAIKSGVVSVVGAVKGLAKDAANALTDSLKINSPSKVFSDIAIGIPEGVVHGVARGKHDVDKAMRHVVDVPAFARATAANTNGTAVPRSAQAVAAASGGGGGGNVTFGDIIINVPPGMTSTQEIGEEVERRMLTVLRRIRTGTGG